LWIEISYDATAAWRLSDMYIATSPSTRSHKGYKVVIDYFPIISFLVLC